MSIRVRDFASLGRFDNDWLKARYHFSFAGYRDPDRMGVGPLRVWNDDEVAPGKGFDPHPHKDMEIVTYIREGAITHRDNLGNEGRTQAGDVQVMSAGTGIVHAEMNLEAIPTRLFQIWIRPDRDGLPPRWETRAFPKGDRANVLVPLASGQAGRDGALPIHQDATLYGATLLQGTEVVHGLAHGRKAYLVVAAGRVAVNGIVLNARDGAHIADEETVTIGALADSEILLADLP